MSNVVESPRPISGHVLLPENHGWSSRVEGEDAPERFFQGLLVAMPLGVLFYVGLFWVWMKVV